MFLNKYQKQRLFFRTKQLVLPKLDLNIYAHGNEPDLSKSDKTIGEVFFVAKQQLFSIYR